jgi:hypothetical protein
MESKKTNMPALFPWELFHNVDPKTFMFGQGFSKNWCFYIWMPYWDSLPEEKQQILITEAPTMDWSTWLRTCSSRSEELKKEINSQMIYGRSLPPSPPWKNFYNVDPYLFTCTQGFEEFWCIYIWMPYWCSLSEEQKSELVNSSPSEAWAEWLMFKNDMCAR